jgi:polyisoprenoid-binding protein YceI
MPGTEKKTKWSIDPLHSAIAFSVRHLMIANVKGAFKKFDVSVYTLSKDFTTAEIRLWIEVASLTTGDEKRDEHLQSIDFFNVPNHKQITFSSHSMGMADDKGNHELLGALTIKGITRNVKLSVQFGGIVIDPLKNEKVGFSVTGKIKRSDWDLHWNKAIEIGGLMVSDDVVITCEVELINSGQKDMALEFEAATGNTGRL